MNISIAYFSYLDWLEIWTFEQAQKIHQTWPLYKGEKVYWGTKPGCLTKKLEKSNSARKITYTLWSAWGLRPDPFLPKYFSPMVEQGPWAEQTERLLCLWQSGQFISSKWPVEKEWENCSYLLNKVSESWGFWKMHKQIIVVSLMWPRKFELRQRNNSSMYMTR